VLAELGILIYKFEHQHLGFGREEKEIIIYDKNIPLLDKNSRSLIGHLSLLFVFIGLVGKAKIVP